MSEILQALYRGDAAAARELARGAELDVFEAAALGETARVRELLEDDPGLANAFGADGFHPLGLACFFGHVGSARELLEHGAAGVIVSNHGGRQLDGVAASLAALPQVAEAVGERVEVLLDGGIRRGTDVLKALALGARAVLAGRAVLWGLAVGGEQGVRDVLELLQAEIALGLTHLGCRSPAEVTRAHVKAI